MNLEIKEKINRLIRDYYRWGQNNFLPENHKVADEEKNKQTVLFWLEEEVRPFKNTALTLIASIQPILLDLIFQLPDEEKSRFFARIDPSSLSKSSESILEKMVRNWSPDKGPPSLSFDNFRNELKDLGRFRIVTNFLSDMGLIKKKLENPYGSDGQSLTANQRKLKEYFLLQNNQFEDLIHLQPDHRNRGERCYKGIFYPRSHEFSLYKIEVQIQTQLQEAWDKKDHFLVYEPRRRGEKLDPTVTIEMFSMSELLYVADLTFDRLKKRIEENREKETIHAIQR